MNHTAAFSVEDADMSVIRSGIQQSSVGREGAGPHGQRVRLDAMHYLLHIQVEDVGYAVHSLVVVAMVIWTVC